MQPDLPSPVNRRHLLRGLALAPLGLALPAAFGPGLAQAAGGQRLSAAQARGDLQLLQHGLNTLHPALHRRATAAQLDAAFDAAQQAVAAGSTAAGLFLLCSQIAAAVNCGHTWASPLRARADLRQRLFEGRDKLPFTLQWVQGRALVTASATPAVAAGSELLAIDGRPVAEIAAALLPLLRADGQHPGAVAHRWAQLSSAASPAAGAAMDWLFPLRFAPRNGRWRLTLRSQPLQAGSPTRSVTVAATTLAQRQRLISMAARPWAFEREPDTAVLRLPSFDFSQSDFKTEAFLARTFAAMRPLPYLVIDLRGNDGGDPAIARQVLAHLLREPYSPPAVRLESAFEQVPADLLPHLGTADRRAFDLRGQASALPGGRWALPAPAAQPVVPVAAPYAGRSVALVGAPNGGTGFLFARDLQRSGAAALLGEPTGGHLQGLNDGPLAWLTLPASGVAVDIPLRASHTVADPAEDAGEPPPDHGVLPELPVPTRFEDAAAGIDTALEAARSLIAGWRPGPQPRLMPTR
jgi:hypothetical protein